jgi:hypothetical protein
MCEEEPFASKYNDWARYGCMKLVGEDVEKFLGPWHGRRQYGDVGSFVSLKRKSCIDVGACQASNPLVSTDLQSKDRCEACKIIVKDVEESVKLLKKPTKAAIADVVESVCDNLKLRHKSSAFLDETCTDVLDITQVRPLPLLWCEVYST